MEIKKILKSGYNLVPFKKELFNLIKAFWVPNEKLFQHLYFKGSFKVKCKNSAFKMLHWGQSLENEIYWKGFNDGWERVSTNIWAKLCLNSEIIFDVGANTGYYSLIAKSENPKSKVYAFEPIGRIFNKLKYNCELNSFDVKLFQIALSNMDGESIIYDKPNEDQILQASLSRNIKNTDDYSSYVEVKVNVNKLATIIKQNNIQKIDLMKIDVEEHEVEFMEGMGKYIKEMRPDMLLEIVVKENGEKITEMLDGLGYLYFDIDEKGQPK